MKKPIYQEIKRKLKKDILELKINNLSESKIIHLFKVSSTTARRVLNDLEEEGLLLRKVGKGSIVISPLNKEEKELGVVFSDIFDPREPFISKIIKGIEEECKNKNYFLHLYTTRDKPIFQNSNISLFHLLKKRKIDGLFIISPIPVSDIIFLQKEMIPFVVIGNVYSEIKVPTVIFDYKNGVKRICYKLLRFGYKKIGLITGPKEKNGIKRAGYFSLSGYLEFLKETNLIYDEKLIKEREYIEEEGYKAMEEFYLLPEKERPDAIVITSSYASKGALEFKEKNIDWNVFLVPIIDEDIVYPFYVKCPYEKIGRISFELLERRIKNYDYKIEEIKVELEEKFYYKG